MRVRCEVLFCYQRDPRGCTSIVEAVTSSSDPQQKANSYQACFYFSQKHRVILAFFFSFSLSVEIPLTSKVPPKRCNLMFFLTMRIRCEMLFCYQCGPRGCTSIVEAVTSDPQQEANSYCLWRIVRKPLDFHCVLT